MPRIKHTHATDKAKLHTKSDASVGRATQVTLEGYKAEFGTNSATANGSSPTANELLM